jgi:hypothetical protein
MTCCTSRLGQLTMGSLETLPLTFDVTAVLLAGEVISNPQAYLVQQNTGLDYSAGRSGSVAISGTTLTQVVTALQPRTVYHLTIQFQVAPGKIWAPYLEIDCPE